MTWIFHVDDLHKNSQYDMIIGQDLLLELKLYYVSPIILIKGNGDMYEGCTAPMKDPYDLSDDASFRNEEVW